MKPLRLIATALSLLCGTILSGAQEIRQLDARDYGVQPVAQYDNGPALQRLLRELQSASASGDSVILRLQPGEYTVYERSLPRHTLYISNHDHVDSRAVALYLDGLRRVRLEAEGATLLCHGRLLPVVIRDCSQVTITGLTIDYPRPAMSQLEILSVEGDEVVGQLPKGTEYAIEEGKLILEGEGFRNHLFLTLPFAADGHMKWGRADIPLNPRSITELGGGRLLLKGWSETPYLAVGDRYGLRSGARPTPAITVSDSEEIALEGVTVHFAEGMGLVAQDTKDISLDRFSVVRREGSDRYFTLQADATHFSNCRGHIRSVGGVYEGMADDAINVHGVYLRVDSLLSESSLLSTFAHPQALGLTWGLPGDTIRLVDRETLLPAFTTTIAAIETPDPTHKVLHLSEPLPDSLPASLALENYSAMPSVLFEGNVVRDNRARGALFSTHRSVICRNNLFDHTHGSAILLSGDANGWYESGPCEDVLITGNHFVNALTAKYQFTNAIISIYPVINRNIPGKYYHGRVVIEGNTFDTFPSPLLYALSVREIVFRNNLVRPNQQYKPLFEELGNRLINVGNVDADLASFHTLNY